MEKRNNRKNYINGGVARGLYEGKAGAEALARAGRNPQLKGIVHEVMFKDGYNCNPVHILRGESAHLTKSATAQMKDIMFMKNGRVHGSAQLKDTISGSGVRKTIDQIRSGHYNKTSILGTDETVAKVAGKVTQKMRSTGISSETTGRIASTALGQAPTWGVVASAAKSGGLSGAVVGGGIEAVSSAIDVLNGDKDIEDAVADTAAAVAKGGIAGAASMAAAPVAAGAVGSAVGALTGGAALTGMAGMAVAAAPVAASVVAVVAVGSAVGCLWDAIFDD